MSKEKKLKTDEAKKETPFYYETIGFIAIIFVIIIFGELGKIGVILNIFFMVCFGDWYWLIVLFILFYGFSNILYHRSFDFKNQKFIGYMICSLGLIILSHFSVHNAVFSDTSGQAYFAITWQHYRDFINLGSYDQYTSLGGGIIGAVIFFLIFYLLGNFGVILISIIIIILGFTMIINRSIVDIIKYLFSKLKLFRKFTFNFNEFFKYEVGKKKEKPALDIYGKDRIVPLKIFDIYQNEMNFNFQEKQSFEIKSLIISVFNNFSIEYREIDIKVSFAVTTFKYYIYSNFDYDSLVDKLRSLIEEKVLITRYNNNVLIEVNNKFVSLLTAKNILMKQSILNNYIHVLGINSENEIEEIDISRDCNILLLGKENVGIRNFIYYFIIGLFTKVSVKNYQFDLYDEVGTFSHLDLFNSTNSENVLDYLNKVIIDIDERMSLIKKREFHNIDEYNKALDMEGKPMMKRKFLVFNYTSNENKKVLEDKLMYIMQMGRLCGVCIIVLARDIKNISSVIMSIVKIKLVFKLMDTKDSMTVLGDSRAIYLDNKGEAIYQNKDKQIRIQTPLISENEIIRIIKSF